MVAHVPPAFASALQRAPELARSGPTWMRAARLRAAVRLAELGMPGPHNEDWKYTDLSRLLSRSYEAPPIEVQANARTLLERFARLTAGGPRIVLVNGTYEPQLSDLAALPPGVRMRALGQALPGSDAVLREHLTRLADYEDQPFVALNTALFHDGAFLEAAPGAIAHVPLQVVHAHVGDARASLTSPRTLIVAHEGSELRVVETFLSTATPGLSNAVTEVVLEPNAKVDHYKLELEAETGAHVSRLDVVLDRASRFMSHAVLLGGALVRNDVNVLFRGEGAECTLNGLFTPRGTQHMDTHTTIDHATPHCTSREYYKGVLDGKSRGVFYGKIFVRKDAQKTNANQTNKNLLLSDGALVDSTPALEINADNVKCTHGSTIGQLDEDALFYLRSRGMEAATARSLLTYAFARDVLDRMDLESLKVGLNDLLLERLPQGQAVREALNEA